MNARRQTQPGSREERLSNIARLFAVPSRGPLEAQLENMKTELLGHMLDGQKADSGLRRELAWAANESAALAWYTGYPTLLFPALFEEKAHVACKRWEHQMELHQPIAA
jgi:hypothetical protein